MEHNPISMGDMAYATAASNSAEIANLRRRNDSLESRVAELERVVVELCDALAEDGLIDLGRGD